MTSYELREAYFQKLIKISQRHDELRYKDAGQIFDIACDMESGKYRKNHKFFNWINEQK